MGHALHPAVVWESWRPSQGKGIFLPLTQICIGAGQLHSIGPLFLFLSLMTPSMKFAFFTVAAHWVKTLGQSATHWAFHQCVDLASFKQGSCSEWDSVLPHIWTAGVSEWGLFLMFNNMKIGEMHSICLCGDFLSVKVNCASNFNSEKSLVGDHQFWECLH